MTILYLMHGFIGSGKSTFSRRLSCETGAAHLNADTWIAQRSPKTSNWDHLYAQALADIWREAETLALAGSDVILDLGFWTYASRAEARTKAAGWGVTPQHYYFATPRETMLSRISTRSGGVAQKNIQNFETLFSTFEPPRPDEDIILVTPEPHP